MSRSKKKLLGMLAFIVTSVMVFGSLSAPVWAQTRPALTRDVDNGDRQTIIIGPETLTIELVDGHAMTVLATQRTCRLVNDGSSTISVQLRRYLTHHKSP